MTDNDTQSISAEDFAAALAIQTHIERIAERRLPLYVHLRDGAPSRYAEHSAYRSFDEDGANLLYDDTHGERERFELPLAILLEPGFEARALAEIATRDAKNAADSSAKETKEAAARERADRATYERLRARFEEGIQS